MSYRSVFKPELFEGQTVVVTGGGSGIGRCTAHEIAALGAHVVDHRPQAREARRGEGRDRSGRRLRARRHAFDIREEAQVKEAVAAIVAAERPHPRPVQQCRRPVPLARRGASAPRASTSWCATTSPAASSSAARSSPSRWQQHGGSIVNMAADFRNGFPNMAHTGAARAGMVNLTMTLAYEWAYRRRARERGVAGLDRLVGHGHLHGRVQGADPQAQGLLPARPARHRERGLGARSASC